MSSLKSAARKEEMERPASGVIKKEAFIIKARPKDRRAVTTNEKSRPGSERQTPKEEKTEEKPVFFEEAKKENQESLATNGSRDKTEEEKPKETFKERPKEPVYLYSYKYQIL